MKNITPLAIVLSLLLLTLTGAAQSPESTNSDNPAIKADSSGAPNSGAVKQVAPEKPAPVRRFNPTEKVAADDAVSFPVDI